MFSCSIIPNMNTYCLHIKIHLKCTINELCLSINLLKFCLCFSIDDIKYKYLYTGIEWIMYSWYVYLYCVFFPVRVNYSLRYANALSYEFEISYCDLLNYPSHHMCIFLRLSMQMISKKGVWHCILCQPS